MDYRFAQNAINFLIIERADLFHWFAQALNLQFAKNEEGFSLLGDDYSEMHLQKRSDAVFSPTQLTLSSSHLKKRLYREMADDLTLTGITEKLHQEYARILKLLDELNFQSEHEIEFSPEIDSIDIFDDFEVRLKEPEGSFVERIVDYTKAVHALLGKDIFFFVNCGSFLGDDDYHCLEKVSKYEEITLIFVEAEQKKEEFVENVLIIDQDFCKIY